MPKKALRPVPEGMQSVTPYLSFNGDCMSAVEFYQRAFGAKLIGHIAKGPEGKVMHAMLKIGDSNIFLSDSFREAGTIGDMVHLWIYAEDADAMFQQATKAGCNITMPIEDVFWGDRLGQVKDPFGYTWSIASAKWSLTHEEIQKAQEEWMQKMMTKA